MSEYRVKRRKIYVEDNDDSKLLINLFKNQELKIKNLLEKINNENKIEINKLKEEIKELKLIIKENNVLNKKIEENKMCEDMRNAYI